MKSTKFAPAKFATAVLVFAFLSTVFYACGGAFNKNDGSLAEKTRVDPSLKHTFDVKDDGINGVRQTFMALHTYLQSRTAGQVESDNIIQLGDYFDLESLTVAGYPDDKADIGCGKINNLQNIELDDKGALLRLIVVGINSFNAKTPYTGGADGRAHIVFQFQNIPVVRRMEDGDEIMQGYTKCEMREYLTPIGDGNTGGVFLAGLVNAGLPRDIIYAPKRHIAYTTEREGTKIDEIVDLIWLPTEWEMFGQNEVSQTLYENAVNQARLSYYDAQSISEAALKRIKYSSDMAESAYWEASSALTVFALVDETGLPGDNNANYNAGIAPAFCIY